MNMMINEAYYDNNPVNEIRLAFKNFVEGVKVSRENNPLIEEYIFFVDTRSLHTVGMDTFCQWKLGMSEEVARETYHWDMSSFDSDQHVSAEYIINDEGNWFNVC